ncbi:MAG: hypothetical protein HKN21_12380 [Candidatus Eisenbacteria bacterium]|uniref:Uncharacterized protein n=1 Tax=Eiseniibacteriota bacterium TaxID=2212470 RepID=A0A7Y2H300_UNCEI|nr:hypothetical protein [Candidatus Eisenbacteria bacterium]
MSFALKVITAGVVGVALSIGTMGGIAWLRMSHLATVFQNPEDQVSLSETSWALRETPNEEFWMKLYPGYEASFQAAAKSVEAGKNDLRTLHEEFSKLRPKLNPLGPPARYLEAKPMMEPLRKALDQVRPWHRQTLLYQEILLDLEAYEAITPRGTAEGQIGEIGSEELITITIEDGNGRPVFVSPRLSKGQAFSFPMDRTYRVRLQIWEKSASGVAAGESKTFSLTSWPNAPIVFRGIRTPVSLVFDNEITRLVPDLKQVSAFALAQLQI